jgi:Transglycosylase-like domain
MPKRWHAPKAWLRQAVCAHQQEGAWNDNTGNGYFGGLQFAESTWEHAGGAHFDAFDHPGDQRGYPFTASIREQLYRAWIVWRRDGGSWREWGYRTRANCGLW